MVVWHILLVTDIWQWSELTSFGDLPSSRDFAAASAIGNRKIVMWGLTIFKVIFVEFLFYLFDLQTLVKDRYGGWDGKKWLSDVYVMDTSNFLFSFIILPLLLFNIYSQAG